MLLEYSGSQSRLRLLNKLFESDLKLESALRACSSAWLERIPDKDEAGGSSPPRPTTHGGLAQLGERLPCKQEVSGSTPLSSTTFCYPLFLRLRYRSYRSHLIAVL